MVGADIGGTFTDIVWRDQVGDLRIEKRLSQPGDYAAAVVDGIGELAGEHFGEIGMIAHATTLATNALLEGAGGRVGLITTRAFRDVLEFGRLQRSDLYSLLWRKPVPLVPRERRVEVTERIAGDGSVVTELDECSLAAAIDVLQAQHVEAIAVCLINSYANPDHERRIAAALRARMPGLPVVISTELLREAGEYERSNTAVVNAYLTPVISEYLAALVNGLEQRGCRVSPAIMQSSGGTIGAAAAARMPVRIVESGPAAGVIGATAVAREYGLERAISFDMGGTTAKACLIEGFRPSVSDEYWVGEELNRDGARLLRGSGSPIRVPTMDVAEVSSGGGSIAWVDAGGALKVGPRSAGADPGPACYGLGGSEPTFTDACVMLGILGREAIGNGRLVLRRELAVEAIRKHVALPLGLDLEAAARGIYQVAISNLMRAIRAVTIDVGRDPAEFALIAFGGGGGMVAASLASELGIDRVLIPSLPGVFSAVGLLTAPVHRDGVHGVFRELTPTTIAEVGETLGGLEHDLSEEMAHEGHDRARLVLRRRLDLHYRGQASTVSVHWRPEDWEAPERACESVRAAFLAEYERRHAHLRDDTEIEVVAARTSAESSERALSFRQIVESARSGPASAGAGRRRVLNPSGPGWSDTLVFPDRASVVECSEDVGLVIDEPDATIFVPRSHSCSVDELGTVQLRPRAVAPTAARAAGDNAASLEIFHNWLGSLNDELTATIARTAQSEIAKDTLDFATAICDSRGRVISQGLTMVLHAGSLPGAIGHLRDAFDDHEICPGDVFLSNDPYLAGGSHLPDVYVIKPLFAGKRRIGFVGTVCHVADMGGRVPGGNAADSREIFAEGLRLPPIRIVERGKLARSVEAILQANVRVPEKVLGDIRSLITACGIAERRLAELVERDGADLVCKWMDALLEHGAALFRSRIHMLPERAHQFRDVIDEDGVGHGPITICASVERRGDRLLVDFAGSDPQVEGAINSPLCFTESAVYYATKAVLGADIPNNSGYFDLVDVRAPAGTVVNPISPAATGAKGVTAFRIVDTLFGALAGALPERVPAAGDGGATIIVFGGRASARPFVFVDIVMSAWGGRPGLDGIDGVSSAASNGRNTPVEVIEATYPGIRVITYEMVPDTGGPGRFRGGLATRRAYEYVGDSPVTLQVRADRNPTAPWGVDGGRSGTVSSNVLIDPSGDQTVMPTKFTTVIAPGTIFIHETAGAGGYGDPADRDPAAIRRDLEQEKVSATAVRRDYGFAPGAEAASDREAAGVRGPAGTIEGATR